MSFWYKKALWFDDEMGGFRLPEYTYDTFIGTITLDLN